MLDTITLLGVIHRLPSNVKCVTPNKKMDGHIVKITCSQLFFHPCVIPQYTSEVLCNITLVKLLNYDTKLL